MGSNDAVALVASRGGGTPADQAQQVDSRERINTPGGKNCLTCQQRLVTGKSDYWKEARLLREKVLKKEENARRMEEQQNNAPRAPPRRHRPPARAPTLGQRNDQASMLDTGARTCAAPASSDNHTEEVLKGQA